MDTEVGVVPEVGVGTTPSPVPVFKDEAGTKLKTPMNISFALPTIPWK